MHNKQYVEGETGASDSGSRKEHYEDDGGWTWAGATPAGDNAMASINTEAPEAGSHGGWPYAPNNAHHDALIQESHARSQRFGLSAQDRPDYSSVGQGQFRDALDENRFLYQHAAPVMETLFDQIANTHSMVLLTARNGLILHSLGDADFLEKASRVALMPGVEWSERSKGTNAIGTALVEERPVVVHGDDHFLRANQFLTCSCTPIFDPYGKVVGALDVTGDQRSYHHHTMALVRMSAQMIENHMFANVFPEAVRIHFHSRPEFLGTLVEGIVVFSQDGRFLSANRSAQFQLGQSINSLRAHTFSSLFGIAMSQFLDRLRGSVGKPLQLCMHNGVMVSCHVRLRQMNPWAWQGGLVTQADMQEKEGTVNAREGQSEPFNPNGAESRHTPSDDAAPRWEKPRAAPTPHIPASRSAPRPVMSGLRYLDTGDAQVEAVLRKLEMVRGRDIPIMILGETGTGKDLLAQAIHHDSERASRPFVSVNCASIPETLIESELFGYEEGAFTGARRKGAPGKILQANGGTLFLDEIGDMPTQLQARLLRVLQERRVNPLGSGKEYEVDVAIVCATNRNLKELIARGQFREDLYYRLNGLVVRLPALRDRSDFDVVAKKILASLCERTQNISISPDVMALFRRYAWPGNFRQLHNLLRTAVAMVGCQGSIERFHLPDDFLDEVDQPVGHGVSPGTAMEPACAAQAANEGAVCTGPLQAGAVYAGPQPASVEQAGSVSAGAGGSAAQQPHDRLEDVTLQAMADALRRCHGNVSAAAKWLGVSRNTIYRKKAQLPPDVWD